MNLAPILPELILTIGSIVLMMVAAFMGRKGQALTSWGAVALLLGATVSLVGAPQDAGPLFGGIIAADGFGAFGKLLIFLSAAVAIVAATASSSSAVAFSVSKRMAVCRSSMRRKSSAISVSRVPKWS